MNTSTQNLCKNCDTELQGEYCHRCGQQDKQYMRSIFAVVGDLFGEIGHWDSRFYRTLRGLFLNPGFLSLEFVQGRHASYVPPLRLYFFISLIAFMVMTSLIDIDIRPPTPEDIERVNQVQQDVQASLPDEAKGLVVSSAEPSEPLRLSLDDTDIPFLSEAEEVELEIKLRQLADNPAQFTKKIISMTPQMMLLMLPFWALFLKLIYLFGHRYYLEHLTVALHTHAFMLLTLTLVTIISQAVSPLIGVAGWNWVATIGDWVTDLFIIWLFVYLFITQKRFYQQSWPVTAVKYLISGMVYFALLTSSFVIMVIIGILNS
ncbi:MAG: DUF3667 domain-containing protein [Idiomarina piscisalsi]|nr:DUF3667 domain-containing protein [Idiomarina piscisalsi]